MCVVFLSFTAVDSVAFPRTEHIRKIGKYVFGRISTFFSPYQEWARHVSPFCDCWFLSDTRISSNVRHKTLVRDASPCLAAAWL